MNFKKIFGVLAALLMVAMLVIGCGPQASETPQQSSAPVAEYEDTVYLHWGGDLDTADPYGSTSAQHMVFTNSTFDMLARNDPDTGEVVPYLAKSWKDVNGDGKVWEFYLEENVKFHDGSEFTSEDVKFTLEYAAKGKTNVVKVISFSTDYIEKIECPSKYTVRMTLYSGMYDFPTYLESAPIYSKTAIERDGHEKGSTIGCGPYYYDKELTQSGVQFACTRFEDYWGGAENFKTKHLVWKVILETDTAVAALENGEIDALTVSGASVEVLEGNKDIEIVKRTGANSYYMGFNFKQTDVDWSNLELRKAVCQLINKQDIVDIAYYGGVSGNANHNFCTPNGIGFSAKVKSVQYDQAAAKATLAKYGYNENNKMVLRLHSYASNKPLGEVIQANMNASGVVDCTFQVVDSTNWTAYKQEGKGFELFMDYAAYQGALLYNFNRFFTDGGSSNVYGFKSAEYEELQANVQYASSYEDMLKEFEVLQQWVADNIPIFPLSYNNMIFAIQKDVEGLVLAPTSNYLDFRTIYIPKR